MKTETRPSSAEHPDAFPLRRRPLAEIAVVVPAWQPDQTLLALVSELRQMGVHRMVLVDDGSDERSRPLFDALESLDGVEVLRHSTNLGKGRALKWAFQHVQCSMPTVRGVVTADADGQHLPGDIVAISRSLAHEPDRAILGVRSFQGDIPWRSRFGNLVTRIVFAWFTGASLRDTQTGLRGLPVSLLKELAALPGDRYEYETLMLAHLCQTGRTPIEQPIQTVYLKGNATSHFRPLQDGFRVVRSLLRAGISGFRTGLPKPPASSSADEPRWHAA